MVDVSHFVGSSSCSHVSMVGDLLSSGMSWILTPCHKKDFWDFWFFWPHYFSHEVENSSPHEKVIVLRNADESYQYFHDSLLPIHLFHRFPGYGRCLSGTSFGVFLCFILVRPKIHSPIRQCWEGLQVDPVFYEDVNIIAPAWRSTWGIPCVPLQL